MNLEILWYLILGIAALMYAILDGFDLGVGAFHLLARKDEQRRIFLNAIGPVWDGNEVWIVIVMGGLFAGFPNVYATLFSGFYTLLMFLIAGLIFRAVAIEFRSKNPSKTWRAIWDIIFSFASILVAFVLGVIVGNLIEGVPLNALQEYTGDFTDLIRPYSLWIGLTAVSLFAMHGAIYLAMKTESDAHEVVRKWIVPSIFSFLGFYIIATAWTIHSFPHMIRPFQERPYLLLFPLLGFLAIGNILYQVRKANHGWAFISSCLSIAFLLALYGFGTFPVILRSTIEPITNSLTIYNTASSPTTLRNLLVVVLIGVPLVLAYGFWTYRIFRGKVKIESTSY